MKNSLLAALLVPAFAFASTPPAPKKEEPVKQEAKKEEKKAAKPAEAAKK